MTISPRTPPEARSARSASGPRHTSSCTFVSSRATAAGRSGPHATTRSPSVAASRRGDSNSTVVRSSAATAANRARRAVPARGRKPSTANRAVGSPLTTSAASGADGPGTTVTSWPASAAAATSRAPGSDTAGMPASVTTATVAPAPTAANASKRRSASLRACSERVSTPVTPAWVSSPRVRRVSSQ